MAGFTDALRGDGLARAQRALAGLEGDPQRLDRVRIRFDDSPLPYTSDRSGTTTLSQSPNPPSEEQRRRQERRVQLGLEADASKPHKQFSHQIDEEEKRVFEASLNGTHRIPVGSDPHTIASENVKKFWVEQGIWNNKWNQFAYGRWKHEEPPKLESESETDSEAGLSPPIFSIFPKSQPKPRKPKSDDEKRRIAERRVIRERERIQESENGEDADAADINTRAYENVKNTWAKRGIWNGRWGILPGMSWKHEEPLEEEPVDGPAPVPANPHVNGSHDASAIHIFGSPSPVESNHRQTSGTMDTSQQRPSGDVGAA
ncbi:MAG: hypothetical protein M1813_005409 [Trichoglossum hirsutum]|nr:MAG: hypothetical protein M1813_005409 [Trichoglossum hirsutum]